MQTVTAGLLVVVLAATAAARDDAADAKAIVEKAVKARGATPAAQTWKDKGVFTAAGVKVDYTADWAFQGPDKYRFALAGKFGELDLNVLVVVNGEKAWASEGGKAEELTGEKLEYTKNEVYQMWVGTLAPLLTEKGFTLTSAKGKDVGGKPAAAVKVTRDKRPAMTLYFDKETGLLVKTEVTVKDEFQKWKEVVDEAYFSDYQEQDGRKVFTKLRVVRDGRPMIEATLSAQKAAEKLNAKLFEKP